MLIQSILFSCYCCCEASHLNVLLFIFCFQTIWSEQLHACNFKHLSLARMRLGLMFHLLWTRALYFLTYLQHLITCRVHNSTVFYARPQWNLKKKILLTYSCLCVLRPMRKKTKPHKWQTHLNVVLFDNSHFSSLNASHELAFVNFSFPFSYYKRNNTKPLFLKPTFTISNTLTHTHTYTQ